MIRSNPTLLIDMPKLHQKEIIRLDADEVARLLDLIETGGNSLTPHQRSYYEKTKYRDLAIITLLLEPVSVCQNVSDWMWKTTISETTVSVSFGKAATK